ncbi:MAG: L,D-transpeptidase family protein [Legionellaceae bacterium]|nr:L,D-transpeptidase family protein [Legionellaceae bacterium]
MGSNLNWDHAVDEAITSYGLPVEPKLTQKFSKAGIHYPPDDIALLAFKQEQHMQLWAKNNHQAWRHVHTYPLTASSGHSGPKLREGDRQIPEGMYHITYLNPFSNMHLSMKINYPNAFDRQHASAERRRRLGSNIFIHGKTYSVGCLAVGDKAIDELFLLTHRVGLEHVQLIIAPNDLRRAKPIKSTLNQPRWVPTLYQNIRVALNQFPLEHKPHLQASLHENSDSSLQYIPK